MFFLLINLCLLITPKSFCVKLLIFINKVNLQIVYLLLHNYMVSLQSGGMKYVFEYMNVIHPCIDKEIRVHYFVSRSVVMY